MLADDVLKDVSNDPQTYSNYRLGDNAGQILNSYSSLIEPYQRMIDAIIQSIGSFEPHQLELVATLHFIHHRLKQIWRRDPPKDRVLEEFRRVKKGKFAEAEIGVFYDALRDAKLI
jgi:hypothetical protein